MEVIGIFALITIGGLILYIVQSVIVRASGTNLANKIAGVQNTNGGKIAGVPYSEIVAECGPPSSVSSMGDGTTLKQWQATGYNIALLFDENDICIGVSSEISV